MNNTTSRNVFEQAPAKLLHPSHGLDGDIMKYIV